MRLYQLESALRQFLDDIEDSAGLLSPEQEDRLQELTEGGEKLIEFLAVASSEAFIRAQIKDAAAREAQRQTDLLKNAAMETFEMVGKVHERIAQLMINLGIEKYKSDLFSISVINAIPKVCVPDDVDVDKLPEEFVRVKKEINKYQIAQCIKEGRPVPGGFGLIYKKTIRMYKR